MAMGFSCDKVARHPPSADRFANFSIDVSFWGALDRGLYERMEPHEICALDLRCREGLGKEIERGAGPHLQRIHGIHGATQKIRQDALVRAAEPDGDRHDDTRAKRQDSPHRRPIRGYEGAARRHLRHRRQGPGRGDGLGFQDPRCCYGFDRDQAADGCAGDVGKQVIDAVRALDRIFRAESGAVLATLIRLLGDFQLAEDALQDAFTAALEAWSKDGMPPSPGAWLTMTARRKAIDRLRHLRIIEAKSSELALSIRLDQETHGPQAELEVSPVPDDQLRLIFTCCHPALSRE